MRCCYLYPSVSYLEPVRQLSIRLPINSFPAGYRPKSVESRMAGSSPEWVPARAITISYFSFGYVAWIFFSWFYTYLAQVRGLNLKASAFYAMLPFLAMSVCCTAGGAISDRLTRSRGPRLGRCVLASVVMLGASVFLVLGSQVESARLASVVLAGGAGALYLAQSSFW